MAAQEVIAGGVAREAVKEAVKEVTRQVAKAGHSTGSLLAPAGIAGVLAWQLSRVKDTCNCADDIRKQLRIQLALWSVQVLGQLLKMSISRVFASSPIPHMVTDVCLSIDYLLIIVYWKQFTDLHDSNRDCSDCMPLKSTWMYALLAIFSLSALLRVAVIGMTALLLWRLRRLNQLSKPWTKQSNP